MNKHIFGLIISAVFVFTVLLGGAKVAYAGCYVSWTLNPVEPAENQEVTATAEIFTSSLRWNNVHMLFDNNATSFSYIGSTGKGGCWGMDPWGKDSWAFVDSKTEMVDGKPKKLCNVPKYEAKVNSGAKGSVHTVGLNIGDTQEGECWPSVSFFTGIDDPNPSCDLDHKLPLIYSAACYDCLASNTSLKGGIDYILSQQPKEANCTRQEAAAHSCNGGISPENQAGCLKEATTTCASSCGASAFSTPSPSPVVISTSVPTPTLVPTPVPTPTPTPAPVVITTAFRYAENPTDLNAAPWRNYTADGMQIDYDFKTPGQKFIFVQFMDSTGKITNTTNCPKCQASIRVLNPDPVITSCLLTFTGNNTTMNLVGQNFGSAKGKAKSNDRDLQIADWKDTGIKVILSNAQVGETLPVSVTNADGQTAEGQCGAVSELSLGAKVFCRAPSSHATDNVDLTLAGAFEGGTKVKQKIKIDKDGIIQGLTQKLEEGKLYRLSVKAPDSLRRTVEFTAGNGITNVPNFILPVGDIFPLDGGDGVINSLDKSELNREFILTQDACGRAGDFNQDCRVNSIDWACMRYDYGQQDNPEAGPGAPTVTSTATNTPFPVTTQRPSTTPTPEPSPEGSRQAGVCEHAAPPVGCHYEGPDIYPGCEARLVCDSPRPSGGWQITL